MGKQKKEKHSQGLYDPDRAAYMIAWRDRHIEKQNELIKGYEESLSLMEALLSFALLQKATEQSDGTYTVCISKNAVSDLLGKYTSEVTDGEEEFTVRFHPVQEPEDGGEQNAG
jgi:hypothetical protein